MLLPKLFIIYEMSLGKNAKYFFFILLHNFLFYFFILLHSLFYIYTHTYNIFQNTCYCYSANEIAMRMKEMLMSGILHESGWTLVGNLNFLKLFIRVILLCMNEITN